jgi:hypothetical protein
MKGTPSRQAGEGTAFRGQRAAKTKTPPDEPAAFSIAFNVA